MHVKANNEEDAMWQGLILLRCKKRFGFYLITVLEFFLMILKL